MKKLFFLSFLLIIQSYFFGQETTKLDTIFGHNKDTILCKVASVGERDVLFAFPTETVTNSLSKNQIREIHFGNGRILKISEFIEVKGANDWEKVQLTNIESDISGLVKKGEVRGESYPVFACQFVKIKESIEKEIKTNASALGAHIIFIKIYQFNEVVQSGYVSSANIVGTAFGYK